MVDLSLSVSVFPVFAVFHLSSLSIPVLHLVFPFPSYFFRRFPSLSPLYRFLAVVVFILAFPLSLLDPVLFCLDSFAFIWDSHRCTLSMLERREF